MCLICNLFCVGSHSRGYCDLLKKSPELGDLLKKSPELGDLLKKSPELDDLLKKSPELGDLSPLKEMSALHLPEGHPCL